MQKKTEYRRNLPHIQPEDGMFFITFRLHGSLPKEVISRIKDEREKNIIQIKRRVSNKTQLKTELVEAHELSFEKFDNCLDNYLKGPTYLANKEIATVVKDSIHYRDELEYKLVCYCIMHNHVHLIIYETSRLSYQILQSLKRFTGREANKLLDRKGAFWQKESYDNLIRSRSELANKIKYVLNNPVKADLVNKWGDWEFSYCKKNFLEM